MGTYCLHFSWEVISSGQCGNHNPKATWQCPLRPFRRVKCPKSRVIHGAASKQQSRGDRASTGSGPVPPLRQWVAPRRGGLWLGGLGRCPQARDSREHLCARWGWPRAGTRAVRLPGPMGGSRRKGLRTCRGGSGDHKETRDSGAQGLRAAALAGVLYTVIYIQNTHTQSQRPHTHLAPLLPQMLYMRMLGVHYFKK